MGIHIENIDFQIAVTQKINTFVPGIIIIPVGIVLGEIGLRGFPDPR